MKKERSAHEKALEAKTAHEKKMKGKKTMLVPHPTIPKCWVEKIID